MSRRTDAGNGKVYPNRATLRGALEVHYEYLHQPVLSRGVASGEGASLRNRKSSAESASLAILTQVLKRNSSRNLDARTFVHAAPGGDFKNCCLRSGAFDGELRNYFF